MTVTTLLACPAWCDGMCRRCSCEDGACHRKHTQHDTFVMGVDDKGAENCIQFCLERQDTEDAVGLVRVHLDLEEASLHLTLARTRELASALNRIADEGGAR